MKTETWERETELELIYTIRSTWRDDNGDFRSTMTISTLTFKTKADKEFYKQLREHVLSKFKPRA